MASKNINVAGLMDEAATALEEKNQIRDKVAALRELLRYAVKAGEATDAQVEWIETAFPARQRGASNGDGEDE